MKSREMKMGLIVLLAASLLSMIYFWVMPVPFTLALGVTFVITILRFVVAAPYEDKLWRRRYLMWEILIFLVGAGLSNFFSIQPMHEVKLLVWLLFADSIQLSAILLIKNRKKVNEDV